jgi:hypothetical protein
MADIVMLPTAAAAPVLNAPRHGRYPRIVTPLWRGKVLQRNREAREERRGREIERLHGQIEGCAAVAHACRLELARLQGPNGAD